MLPLNVFVYRVPAELRSSNVYSYIESLVGHPAVTSYPKFVSKITYAGTHHFITPHLHDKLVLLARQQIVGWGRIILFWNVWYVKRGPKEKNNQHQHL